MARTVLIVGATGLVGTACVRRMLADDLVESVVVLARHGLSQSVRAEDAAGKLSEHVIEFSELQDAAPGRRVDGVISALGTTMRRAGSKARFRSVDFDIPLRVARLGRSSGARHFVLVSAIGASSRSPFFYSRVKGELEEAIGQVGFDRITILRPSVLLGSRGEFRLAEEIGKRVMYLMPRRYRPVSADDVANVAVQSLRSGPPGVEIIESDEIRRRARS